ncbi:uncharacterized protein LOC129737801 [Uranotaenia lowii]|uniref:uncharacterized protein LOC129737801 n=1 Tax=Uranotaenia lowii TaxID=190385 RepID=UPI0024785FAB|nr:uncharacterized protein LOC129737801 [Uranotaenia lowii]
MDARGKLQSGESSVEGDDSTNSSNTLIETLILTQLNSIIINPGQDNRPHAVIGVLGKELKALLDSGTTCSLLGGSNVKVVDELGLRKGNAKGGIQTANGTAVSSVDSRLDVKAVCCTLETIPTVAEVEDPKEHVTMTLSDEEQRQLNLVVQRFPKAEDGELGRTQLYEHRIDVGDAPTKKQRHYPMSKYVLEEVNKEFDRMLAMDVIEEAMFSPWNNPLVAVKKKNGKCRVCLDARYLNSVMVYEGYPIPQISSIINN